MLLGTEEFPFRSLVAVSNELNNASPLLDKTNLEVEVKVQGGSS